MILFEALSWHFLEGGRGTLAHETHRPGWAPSRLPPCAYLFHRIAFIAFHKYRSTLYVQPGITGIYDLCCHCFLSRCGLLIPKVLSTVNISEVQNDVTVGMTRDYCLLGSDTV